MCIENYCRHRALYTRYPEDLVLENLAKSEYVFRSKQADNVVFTSDFVDIGDLGKFHQTVSDLLKFSRLDE